MEIVPGMDSSPSSPVPKKARLQGRFWELGKSKVCFALLCMKVRYHKISGIDEVLGREYNICVVDLSSDTVNDRSYPAISPTLHIDCGFDDFAVKDGFCVFGNTLYMFEGYCDESKQDSRKGIYAFDISNPCKPQSLLKSELKKEGEMLSLKRSPVAIPAPDGKRIIVFSTENVVGNGSFSENEAVGWFELFDTDKKSSETLPPIEIEEGPWWIEAYGFIDSTRFLVQIKYMWRRKGRGMYVYDFASEDKDKGWVYTAEIFNGIERIPKGVTNSRRPTSYFEVVQDRFIFSNAYGAEDLEDPDKDNMVDFRKFFVYKPLGTTSMNYTRDFNVPHMVTLLKHKEETGECYFCELHLLISATRKPQAKCLFELDVGGVNLNRYKQDLQAQGIRKVNKLEYIQPLNTLQCSLDFGGAEYRVYTLPFFLPIWV